MYLDTQAWGSLLKWNPKDYAWIHEGLKFNCKEFSRPSGFYEAKEKEQIRKQDFAWLEGSYSMVLALKVNQTKCLNRGPASLSQDLQKYQDSNGGVPYSVNLPDSNSNRFSDSLSIASTSWKYFSDQEVNPFQID